MHIRGIIATSAAFFAIVHTAPVPNSNVAVVATSVSATARNSYHSSLTNDKHADNFLALASTFPQLTRSSLLGESELRIRDVPDVRSGKPTFPAPAIRSLNVTRARI